MDKLFKIHCSQIGKIMSNAKSKGDLSVTCQTFLKEWYANEREEIHSKYITKGNLVEIDLIDFMAEQLGLGMAEKNEITLHNEWMVGTCDVATKHMVIDVKASWNRKTLQDQAISEIDKDYEWQGRGYMALWDKPEFIVFHGLMNTPEEANYDGEVIYDDMPPNERWIAYKIKRDVTIEQEIIARVIQCRAWLEEYDKKVKSRLGKVIEI
jgi:hypothetical protein